MKRIVFSSTTIRRIYTTCTAAATNSKQGDYPDDCGIVGKWKDELGSTVEFKTCKNGQIDGLYHTAVGEARRKYVLTGRYTISGPNKDVAELGWVVSWNNAYKNSHSATSWNGIYYAEEKKIYTQWILTSYEERKDLWRSSIISHDEFKRVD